MTIHLLPGAYDGHLPIYAVYDTKPKTHIFPLGARNPKFGRIL